MAAPVSAANAAINTASVGGRGNNNVPPNGIKTQLSFSDFLKTNLEAKHNEWTQIESMVHDVAMGKLDSEQVVPKAAYMYQEFSTYAKLFEKCVEALKKTLETPV